VLALLGQLVIGPCVQSVSNAFREGVDFLVIHRVLPLADIIIEPAKVLFLNNALNHGVLAPAGVAEVAQSGKAIHFLLESNPGPGLGMLLAFYVSGKGMLKQSAPGAMIVHFLGGIHEIYFPYVLAHPVMIVSMWAGGIAADFVFVVLHAGLVATPSPGSIFAYLAVIPKGGHVAVLSGVAVGIIASFLVGSMILKLFPVRETAEASEPAQPDAELAPV
jgi:PTS system mannitol-specific IIC component